MNIETKLLAFFICIILFEVLKFYVENVELDDND